MHMEKHEKMKGDDNRAASKVLLDGDLERMILDKIFFQWGEMRKAFKGLTQIEKSGKISQMELKYYLKHWGMEQIPDEIFQRIFQKFDLDGDGKISYKDFQN